MGSKWRYLNLRSLIKYIVQRINFKEYLMKTKIVILSAAFLFSHLAQAKDDTDQTIGLSSSTAGTSLIFDNSQKSEGSIIGLKGNIPLSSNMIALEKFKERAGQKTHSFIQLYGQVDVGYSYKTK